MGTVNYLVTFWKLTIKVKKTENMFLIYVKTGLKVVDDLLYNAFPRNVSFACFILNKPFFANSITLLPICLYFALKSKLLTILQLIFA